MAAKREAPAIKMERQLGIFCGTFNPIHWGHLLMAETARSELGLEKVLIITSPNPPHRQEDLLDATQRHALVEAAVADNPHFEASALELERQGPSYTVDTLKQISQLYPNYGLNFILGQDNIAYIDKWHDAKTIFSLCRICIAPREPQTNHYLPSTQVNAEASGGLLPAEARSIMLNIPHIPVSSTLIRQRIRAGNSVLYLVPSAVNEILEAQGFYK